MRERLGALSVFLLIALPMLMSVHVGASGAPAATQGDGIPIATPSGRVATAAELAAARATWLDSAHADTYDEGLGANTTCARCKSPFNWDPSQELAQQAALDCASCKRVPGASRPELAAGIPVTQAQWHNITCDVCHIPVDDSYDVTIAFWNQEVGHYEPVASVQELCAKCHEGQHGFRVIAEQAASPVHAGMTCTTCHGDHSGPAACTDCHDPGSGAGAREHARHPTVNCSGCHDAGGLSVWKDPDPASRHLGTYITVRFAHTLTSWPSHDLTTAVNCRRCHHPEADRTAALVPDVACTDCHEHAGGAVSQWCTYFQRDADPRLVPTPAP